MANYVVKFSIEIPVAGSKTIADKIDAYYAARNEFNDFNVDEFDKEIRVVDDKTVADLRATIDKLHKNQK